ncbi:MAG: STAS domain-containing protein [Leptospiraceae bacterium]|nr:STAS domain-containing protein [Leptospiraceae bacterium]
MSEVITIVEDEGVQIIHFQLDQIDMFNIIEVLDETNEQVADDACCLLDLERVRFIDSSGLGGIIKLNKRLKGGGGRLGICNLNNHVESLFRLTQTIKLLDCYEDVPAGLKDLASSGDDPQS